MVKTIGKRWTANGWEMNRELAMYYFPARRPEVAVAHLRRWIASDPEMLRDLKRAGYRLYARRFSPRQVRVLAKYLS